MEVLAKVTLAFGLLPVVSSGITIAQELTCQYIDSSARSALLAQTIVPTNETTQVIISDQGVTDISGGISTAGNLFHSFEQFNLDQQHTANFITTPITDTVIGQVIGGTASTIDGLLQVTGSHADLYLVNPAGVIFGPNARLDLGGSFTATTATHLGNDTQWFDVLSNSDYSTWVSAPSQFGFSHSGTITNHGTLTVDDGQSLRLLAPQITNTGILNAPGGEVTLLTTAPDQTIHLPGLLSLEGISSSMDLAALPASITGGELHHSTALVSGNHGEMALVNREVSPEIGSSFSITNTGDISTQGAAGGVINLLGDTIQVLDGKLDVSGKNGDGGSIRIGGDRQGQGLVPRASQTIISDPVTLSADAIEGNGGQVIVWSDGSTIFNGSISAQSVTGNGGLVETSGLSQLSVGNTARVNTSTLHGENGLWLLDPAHLTIIDSDNVEASLIFTDINDAINSTADHSVLSVSTVTNALDTTNITLQATDSITIASPLDASNNSTTNDLLLDTAILNLNEQITLNGNSQLSGTATTVNVGKNGSIQNGVDTVASGGTVHLAATTYHEGDVITLDHALTLVGQGQTNTYISGDADNNGTGNHQVINITNRGDNITLTGITIQDGLSASAGAGLSNNGNNVVIHETSFLNNEIAGSSQDGGAIHNRGSLTLVNTFFENNRSGSDGGAIDIIQGSVDIVDSTFSNNRATGHGGAIDVDPRGRLSVVNTGFLLNTAGTHGGAIYSEGDLKGTTVNFTQNSAGGSGGGVFLANNSEIQTGYFFQNIAQSGGGLYNTGQLNLLTSIVTYNQAIGVGTLDGGGGLHNTSGGRLTIDASLVSNNTSATSGGGVLNLAGGRLTEVAIANSAIVGNQATTNGGGVEIASIHGFSELTQFNIVNSTVSGNQASIGGGIRTVGPTTVTNVTITANTATRSGGGLSENLTTAAIPELINTIVADNGAPTNPDVEGQFNDRGNNLIGVNQGSTGFNLSSLVGTINTPIEPNLTPLNNNIGPLPSHQLRANSPAANAGNNSVATSSDQHGQPRIVGGIIDLGAVESTILPTAPPSPNVTPTPPLPSQPLPSQPLPSQPSDTPIPLNEADVLSQEEKTLQTLGPDPEQTHLSAPSGRLRYFDEEAFQYLEDTFSQKYEDHWQLPQTQTITLPTVQQTLQQANAENQSRSAIIYAVFVPQSPPTNNTIDRFVLPRAYTTPTANDRLLLILVTATGNPVQYLVNVSRAELTRQAKLFRLAVSDPEDELSYQALARQMYGWLLAPLQPDLAQNQIDHVIYSLDQGLRTIPLAAMMQADAFVIEQYGISVIPSMGLTQPQFGNSPSAPRSLVAGASQFKGFESLPAVPIEINVVAKNTQATNILLNETFTLDNLLNLQTSQQPDLLHLATHAEFNAGNLDQSFIQFWDSQLTFDQMRELSWSEIELLILSACGTAISSPDAELGFTGLAAAAGIETSMGSLWNVSDVGTLALMTEFYAHLSPRSSRFRSLQQAQLSLIRGNTHIHNSILNTSHDSVALPSAFNFPASAKFSHPFYWAGFTMVGNPWH